MYKLVKISHTGQRTGISSDFSPEELIETGERLLKKFPNEQYGVADERGFFVWPERLAKAHVVPDDYDPSQGMVPNRYGSKEQ